MNVARSGKAHAILAVLLASLPVVSAPVRAVAESGAAAGPAMPVEEEGPRYAVATRKDRAGRILAPVQINGRGPFRFILDTGANRSAISADTVAALGLAADHAVPMDVHGVTGTATLPSVEIASLLAGDFELGGRRLPVLPAAVFGGADGILGIDALQTARIEVDFRRDRVTVRRSKDRRADDGEMVVRAEQRHGGLLLVDGRVGRVPVKAILDTGAERSLGNEALRSALALAARRPQEEVATTVIGATPQVARGVSFTAPTIAIGDVRLNNLVVTFGDLHVFGVWSLDEEPALLLGMDLLGRMQRVVIDYPRGEFRLQTARSSAQGLRRCGANECQSRIPQPDG